MLVTDFTHPWLFLSRLLTCALESSLVLSAARAAVAHRLCDALSQYVSSAFRPFPSASRFEIGSTPSGSCVVARAAR